MLQFDEYKVKLNNLAPTLEELGQALDLEGAERELDMLQAESAADGFWNNLEKAQKVQQRIKTLQNKVDKQHKRCQEWDDLMALCEMGNEFEDESDHADSHRAALHDGFAPIHGFIFQLVERNHFIHHPHLFGFFGGVLTTEEPDFAGFFLTDVASEIGGTESSIETTDLGTCLSETGILGSDREVAHDVKYVASTDSVPVYTTSSMDFVSSFN